ncbi:MAG: hypothetical protein EOO87_16930 [Pedobacter sp.]|nr:MAG: hypothetical protein EOO87_16930 [Pedobacter sp.]
MIRKIFKGQVLAAMLLILWSCSKSVNNSPITKSHEYWRYDDQQDAGFGSVFYKFHNNGSYDRYTKKISGEYSLYNDDGDVESEHRKWSISNDSIMNFGNLVCDVVRYNENVIVLYLNKHNRYLYLFKEDTDDESVKEVDYYINKGEKFPEKYAGLIR